MANAQGATIIGYTHGGEEATENARKVIIALDKQGLDAGDVVALELSQAEIDYLLGFIQKGHGAGLVPYTEKRIKEIPEEMAKLLLAHPEAADLQPRLNALTQEYHMHKNRLDDLKSTIPILTFLAKRGAIIRGFENENRGKGYPVWNRKDLPKRKRELIYRLLLTPSREKRYAQRLKNINPRFVLTGPGHVPAIKRMIPVHKVITLSTYPLKDSIKNIHARSVYRIRAARRTVKRAKNKLLAKRR